MNPFLRRSLHLALLVAVSIVAVSAIVGILPASLAGQDGPGTLEILATFVVVAAVLGLFFLGLDRLPRLPALAVILAAAASLRLLWVLAVPNCFVSDYAIYQELARSLASGQGYTLTGPVGQEDLTVYLGTDKTLPYTTAYRAPGVPIWGAFLIRLFGDNGTLFKLANVLFDTMTVFLLWLLLQTLGEDAPARRTAAVWALYPTAIAATNLYGSEVIFTSLLVLLAVLIVRWRDRPFATALATGIVTGGAAMVRSMLSILLAGLWAGFAALGGLQRSVRAITIVTAAALLVLSPWIARNARVFHRFIPVCTAEGEFLGRHSAMLLELEPERLPGYSVWRAIPGEAERSAAGYRLFLRNEWELLRRGPVEAVRLVSRALASCFSDDTEILFWSTRRSHLMARNPGPAMALPYGLAMRLKGLTSGFYLAIVLAAVLGVAARAGGRVLLRPEFTFLALHFLLSMLTNAVLYSRPRYHFVMMPFLVVAASLAFVRLIASPADK